MPRHEDRSTAAGARRLKRVRAGRLRTWRCACYPFDLMDTHSEPLGRALLDMITSSPECADLRKVPPDLLSLRTHEIYRDLNEWLGGKTLAETGRYYRNLGAERAEQGVSLSHLIWAIRAAKKNLWEFLEREGLWENPIEIHGSLELLALLDRFFDEAIYSAAVGYERYHAARALESLVAHSG